MTISQGSSPRPRVSVVVPAYNSAHFIEATLQAALGQTFRDLELLVVDDGSTDFTADVVRGVMARDPRVRLFVQAHRGLSAARNHAIAAAQGDLIALLDHDDLWHPEKLALQVALLDAHDDVGVVSCYSAVIDEDHRCLGWQFGGDANGDVYAEMLEWDMVSGGSVALIRRAALETNGSFDETLTLREDWDLRIRLARDYFSMACFRAIDRRHALAWRYLIRSAVYFPAPLLRSPRRCAFVVVLALQSVLPKVLFRPLFAAVTRFAFRLEPGRPFLAPAGHP